MKKEQLNKLAKLCFDNGLPSFTVIVAMHIAMDRCDDPDTIKSYGTYATDELCELKKDLGL